MTILHTADWHLGHVLYENQRTEEQLSFLAQIARIAAERKPDVFILAGDVYDTDNPSVDTVKMFNDAMLALRDAAPSMTIVVTAGNHDSYRRLEANNALWHRLGVHVVGVIARTENGLADLDKHIIPVRADDGSTKAFVLAVPHAFPQNFPLVDASDCERRLRPARFFEALCKRAQEINEYGLPVFLTAHLAVGGSDFAGHDEFVGFQENFSQDIFGDYPDYIALGHIHKPQTFANGKIRYAGTPVAVSFDEKYPHSVSLVTIDRHGGIPIIESIEIANPHPLVTIPGQGFLLLDEAMACLEAYPVEKEDYLRMNILPSGFAVAEIANRAASICKDKKSRFCVVNVKRNETAAQNGEKEAMTVEEFKKMSPIEVARMYYRKQEGTDMPETFRDDLEDLMAEMSQSGQ